MFARQTFVRLISGLAVCLAAAVPALAQESAWEEYIRRNPGAVDDDTLGPLERNVLHALSPAQAQALYEGAAPEEIVLDSGATLADFLRDSVGGGPGLVYVPVDQCRLFATSAQTAPVTGAMAADEIRDFVARGAGTPHTDQGGMVTGCGIPTEAVAVLVHFRVVANRVQDARGFLKAWRSDGPEPSTHLLDYEPAVDPPLADRFRFNATAAVELCEIPPLETGAAACAGEFKVKTALLGGQVRGDAAGYFRLSERADVPEAGDADTLDGLDSTDFALASHTHDGGDINSGTVGEPFIDPLIARDGEVVDLVKAGDGAGSGIDADLLDGRDSLDFALQAGNCLTVSPSCPVAPAEALAARCWTTIQAAIDAVHPTCTGSCLPGASAANRYLIKVGPGVYTEQVDMTSFVDIEGSGEKLTVITNVSSPTLAGHSDAELRMLTVENTGGGTAILSDSYSTIVQRVTARSTGAGAPKAVELMNGGAPMLTHVTTESDGEGVENNDTTLTIRDSVLTGATNAIANTGASPTASIVSTQIDGGAADGAAGTTFTCLGAYDASFTELDTNCQP